MINEKDLILCFKALNDPVRLSILNMLRGRPAHSYELLEGLSISQPTLSYHMKILRDAQLVTVRQMPHWKEYSLNAVNLGNIARNLQELAEGKL